MVLHGTMSHYKALRVVLRETARDYKLYYEWYYESLPGNTSVTTMYYEVLLVVFRITMRYYEKFKENA